MRGLFLMVLSMSGTASLVILLVLLFRLFLRKAPRVFSYALWAAVLFRLLCPVTVESPVGIIPSGMPVLLEQRLEVADRLSVADRPGAPDTSGASNISRDPDTLAVAEEAPDTGGITNSQKGRAAQSVTSLAGLLAIATSVWLCGAAGLLLYSLISLFQLQRRLLGATPLAGERQVWLADHLSSPFVLGLFRPRIFLPSDLPKEERRYILFHERTHIRRLDPCFRALAWLAAVIHWFNPLVWLAFYLAGKDMEISCDEAVLRNIGRDIRADYSSTLLRLSTGKRLPIGPLAFGDSRLQSRIKHVLHYKKPALWVINLALITVLAAGTALATDRGAKMAGGSGRIGLDGQNGQHEQNGQSQSLRPSTPASSNAGGPPSEKGLPETDVNHNGIPETLRLSETGNELSLDFQENGTKIWSAWGSRAPSEWNALFLCTLDGEDYLLRYRPTMYQGNFSYGYELFFLKDGVETTVQQKNISFDTNFSAPFHGTFDPIAISVFVDELNGLLAHSVQLFNTHADLQAAFDQAGTLTETLWWLDDFEGIFTRDPSKSMSENLQDFQAAMTRAQTPAVPVKTDSLPLNHPVEMEFLSGAGAWRTTLTLSPDGSFAGEYTDSDADVQYICRFHGSFGDFARLTDASWSLTLKELVLDTGHPLGEEWRENGIRYISSGPYGLDGPDGAPLEPGSAFLLYTPEATGYAPGTELYGALPFWTWWPGRRQFIDAGDQLGCYGLHNLATGYGFFSPDA
ncbi:M56 family metallopeptidase [Enterocloster asparagiformis]|uniref:M56 family metallopeptidase n=1 Tax=Enterocloster asparagiformis TaxID=333367 RepID=UPI002A81942F|nr:M56 family metallopeptidase [Enterocloster asparagiformis]